MFENINVDWNLSHDDGSTDFSDDDTMVDERVSFIFILKHQSFEYQKLVMGINFD